MAIELLMPHDFLGQLVVSAPFVDPSIPSRLRASQVRVICAGCASHFVTRLDRINRGRGWFCSRLCALQVRLSPLEVNSDLAELTRLLYPEMGSPELAAFLGVSRGSLNRFARAHGIRKSLEWKLRTGQGRVWPEDPRLRELQTLKNAITRTINRRKKEAA